MVTLANKWEGKGGIKGPNLINAIQKKNLEVIQP